MHSEAPNGSGWMSDLMLNSIICHEVLFREISNKPQLTDVQIMDIYEKFGGPNKLYVADVTEWNKQANTYIASLTETFDSGDGI